MEYDVGKQFEEVEAAFVHFNARLKLVEKKLGIENKEDSK